MGTRTMQNKKNGKTETKGDQLDTLMSDLDAQHSYVEGLKKTGDKGFQLIATSAFVEGMRDSGYKSTATATDEFIDNGYQAQATRVDIVYEVVNPEGNQQNIGAIAVIDNGHGME